MSLGPIRELSAGPKPGGVSTFTETERMSKRSKKERGKKGKYKKGTLDAFTCLAFSHHLSGAA